MAKRRKRPRDMNQLGKMIVDEATGNVPLSDSISPKKEAGRRGGLKGGKARAAKLTASQRSKIAKNAAKARWGKAD